MPIKFTTRLANEYPISRQNGFMNDNERDFFESLNLMMNSMFFSYLSRHSDNCKTSPIAPESLPPWSVDIWPHDNRTAAAVRPQSFQEFAHPQHTRTRVENHRWSVPASNWEFCGSLTWSRSHGGRYWRAFRWRPWRRISERNICELSACDGDSRWKFETVHWQRKLMWILIASKSN